MVNLIPVLCTSSKVSLRSQHVVTGLVKGGSGSSNTENSHCLLVRCSSSRWWWSCLHCSTRRRDTRSTVVGPAETVSWSGSPSAASSSSPRKREFLKDNSTKQYRTATVNQRFSCSALGKVETNPHLRSTCAKAQNGPLGQYPV